MDKSPGQKWHARNKHDLIVEVWEQLDCDSVGSRELEQIQEALRQKFGEGALESPASIARTLADEGAVFRHSEVFNSDLKWRERNLAERSLVEELDFSGFSEAVESLQKVEEKRRELKAGSDKKRVQRLRDIVASARSDSLLRSRSKILDQNEREQAREISSWLGVWLQSPELFPDWLDLRRRSPEFRKKFADSIQSSER
jgi:hypothetical protein